MSYSRSDEEADSRSLRRRMRFLLRVEQVSVVAELVPEPAEAVGVSGGDAAAEVEHRVSQVVDLLEVHIQEISGRVEDCLDHLVGCDDDHLPGQDRGQTRILESLA